MRNISLQKIKFATEIRIIEVPSKAAAGSAMSILTLRRLIHVNLYRIVFLCGWFCGDASLGCFPCLSEKAMPISFIEPRNFRCCEISVQRNYYPPQYVYFYNIAD